MSAIGIGRENFWRALLEARSGVVPIEEFPVPPDGPRLAAAVRDLDPRELVSPKNLRRMDRFSRMIVAAGRMALSDARIDLGAKESRSAAVVVGTAYGNVSESTTYLQRVLSKGPQAASPMLFPNLVLNAATAYMALELGVRGVSLTVAQGEISGEQALMNACDLIRHNRAELVLAGGGDELAAVIFDIHRQAGVLSSQRGGEEWSSPYDRGRNGIVLGEGAAMMVLECAERASARGARPYALIEDYSTFAVPAPAHEAPASAKSAVQPLRRLLSGKEAPDVIYGCGNSSQRLDACELELLALLLGDEARSVSLTSIKGATGELGAAGALTSAAAALSICKQIVPPLCRLRAPEPTAPFTFVSGQGAPRRIARALQLGIARGGSVAALLWQCA